MHYLCVGALVDGNDFVGFAVANVIDYGLDLLGLDVMAFAAFLVC